MSDSNNQDMKLLINYLINNSVNSNSYPKGTSHCPLQLQRWKMSSYQMDLLGR